MSDTRTATLAELKNEAERIHIEPVGEVYLHPNSQETVPSYDVTELCSLCTLQSNIVTT